MSEKILSNSRKRFELLPRTGDRKVYTGLQKRPQTTGNLARERTLMGRFFSVVLILFVAPRVFAQADVQPLLQVQNAFDKAASERGMKSAFLEFLGDDAIIFQPHPMNGKKYWSSREADPGKQ